MASRLKEDERNERTIRNLLKLPENRRCINCNSLGPQYVCTNFWTFVCTTCSGIHREFTHRVKSVSMAKFTSQEVSALQGGGNASAKEIYFKEWDAQRQSFPDSSNVERLRDFIKHVYVDRRYTGERSFDKPSVGKMGGVEETYQGGSRSPPFENERGYNGRRSPGGRNDDRSSKNSYDERRSPGYDQNFRSPARTDVVNDWRREDRFGNGRRSEDGGFKVEGRSPDSQRDSDVSSPPVVRPVRDILGETASPLRIIEPPKANGPRPVDRSMQTQRTVSSSSLASSNGNAAELRTETSLIDFDAVPEPPSTASVPHMQQSAPPAPMAAQPTTSSNDNWANFDSVPQAKASQAPSNANLLDALSELSVPPPMPGGVGASVAAPGGSFPSSSNPPMANTQMPPFGTSTPVATTVSHSLPFAAGGAQASATGPLFNAFANNLDGGQWKNMNPQQNLLPVAGSQPPAQAFNQPWNPSPTTSTQVSSNAPGNPQPQVTQEVDVKPSVKKELPADLFSSSYSSFGAPRPGWYPAPQYGMGFNMQYNIPPHMPLTFPPPSKSANPFDVNDSPSVQATTFPSMAPLQGALPTMPPTSSIQRTSSFGSPSPMWMPPQRPSYGSAMPSGPFMGQVPTNMPPPSRAQIGGNQHESGLYSTPNTLSWVGGNPFG